MGHPFLEHGLTRAFSPLALLPMVTQGFALGWEVSGLQPAEPMAEQQQCLAERGPRFARSGLLR